MGNGAQISRRTALGLAAGTVATGLLPADARAGGAGLAAHDLRLEWLTEPVGIDTLKPRFHWNLMARQGARNVLAGRLRIIVASTPQNLAARRGDIWDSGLLATKKTTLAPAHSLPLRSHTPYYWALAVGEKAGPLAWSEAARFVTGMIEAGEWRGRWIAARPDIPGPAHVRGQSKLVASPADTVLPLMRKTFDLDRTPARAVVSVSGLGHFELTVNGAPVTDSVLNPGWTEYSRTILYTSYDIGMLLRPGANVLGVRLGNGMYNVEKVPGRKSKFVDSFGKPKLLLQLSLHFADGSVEYVVSDTSWQTIDGPILFSSIFAGEDVDARREPKGWDLPDMAVEGWRPVVECPAQPAKLKAQGVPPVRMHRRFETVAISEPKPGVFVYDLGENFAGRPEMVVRGTGGATVKLTPCEVLDTEGMAWQKSFNAGAPDRWVLYNYTLAGTGDERFVPRFNYHGFRYLQVEGAVPHGHDNTNGLPEIVSLAGQFLHADLPRTGAFDCSDALFVRTHRLIERAVLSNTFSVLTDCPHREKLGWLEQTHLNAATIMYNCDASTLYEKMIGDICDAQRPDGMVPGIAPEYVAFLTDNGQDQDARNSPEWGAAVVLSAWAAYRAYGNPRILHDSHAAAQRYAAYLATRAQGHILDFGLGDWYDVGPGKLGASQLTSRALTATATYYQLLDTMARIARVIGRPAAEVAAAEHLAAQVKAAFNARFLDTRQGCYDRGSQTANAMPLALGMVPPAHHQGVLEALVRAVRASENGITAGDVGFHYVVRALSENGRNDVMFDMMSVTDRPSYGYQLAQGATALTESWSADPTKSLNHFMLGHGEGWLFGALAGIRVDFAATGDRILTVAPKPVGTVAMASATCRTVLGEVRSTWRRTDGVFALDVDIPAGARACVVMPVFAPSRIRESGRPVTGAHGIGKARRVATGTEMLIGSGQYRFTAPFADANIETGKGI